MELYFAALKKQTDFYIKKSFYECLEQNIPLNITTLCAQAGIGRRTFYRHFLRSMKCSNTVSHLSFQSTGTRSGRWKTTRSNRSRKNFSDSGKQKRELRLLGRYDEAKLSALLFEDGVSLIKERSDDRFHLFSVYSAGGFLGLLNWWIAEDFHMPVQELIVQFVQEAENIFSKDISWHPPPPEAMKTIMKNACWILPEIK